ncbi:MAG: methyltransferase [Nanoarchaeota archaeon]|nr:methyltransferase [Nanoarchaeota archaeon]MBU1004393.1 methyltransferase [Nanoarchaeota archaeon]MBU1946720.1 methyltransferase [Nanoarchaeota archaeon]
MKGLVVCSKGTEDICSLEINEIIGASSEKRDSCIIFDIKKLEELCILCYKAQSVEKVILLLDNFEFKGNFEDALSKSISKLKFDKWLDKETSFRVTCKKINNEQLSSEQAAADAGAFVIDNIKKKKKYKQKVELDNPGITFLLFINKNHAYFGIDFSGRDLHKREYKLFAHPNSLRSTIAYSVLRIAGFSSKEGLFDPFCHSGEIPIEAALFTTNFPVNYFSKEKFAFLKFKTFKTFDFDKFFNAIDKKILKPKKSLITCVDFRIMNLNAAKKNAKIAGINKFINFSRIDVEWLDIKLEKESIGRIITHPPDLTKHCSIGDIEKLYDKFFYQAEYILKKKGKVVLISKSQDALKKAAEKYKFKVEKEAVVCEGKEVLNILVCGK